MTGTAQQGAQRGINRCTLRESLPGRFNRPTVQRVAVVLKKKVNAESVKVPNVEGGIAE